MQNEPLQLVTRPSSDGGDGVGWGMSESDFREKGNRTLSSTPRPATHPLPSHPFPDILPPSPPLPSFSSARLTEQEKPVRVKMKGL